MSDTEAPEASEPSKTEEEEPKKEAETNGDDSPPAKDAEQKPDDSEQTAAETEPTHAEGDDAETKEDSDATKEDAEPVEEEPKPSEEKAEEAKSEPTEEEDEPKAEEPAKESEEPKAEETAKEEEKETPKEPADDAATEDPWVEPAVETKASEEQPEAQKAESADTEDSKASEAAAAAAAAVTPAAEQPPQAYNKEIPRAATMKAALATGIEDIDEHIKVHDYWPQPTLATAKDAKTGSLVSELTEEGHMIVKVLSCALTPGDCSLFKGKADMMQLPYWARPYIIGSDICGIVTEVSDKEEYFKVGDRIIARFDEPQSNGMCAEYACVKTRWSEKCPATIPANQACTLPTSAAAAKQIAEKFVEKGQRVLVLGASGGVGVFLCQYIKKEREASFLAATTTKKELAESLRVDRVIDYRETNWWELHNERAFKDKPFDVVIDLVNASQWDDGGCSGSPILAEKAVYVQVLPGIETEIDMGWGYVSMIPYMFVQMQRSLWSAMNPGVPKYEPVEAMELKPGDLKGIMEDVEQKRIRVILDPAGPFEMTTESVKAAMKLQLSNHAHGKVVVEIAKDDAS